mgnify:CR=1 FL=1
MKEIQSNGFLPIIAQAIAEMEEQHGEFSGINEINLAELGRRTGLSRARLRRLKANGFCETVHGLVGKKRSTFWTVTVLFWIACSEMVSATLRSAWSSYRRLVLPEAAAQ